jgi:hypothetical protein
VHEFAFHCDPPFGGGLTSLLQSQISLVMDLKLGAGKKTICAAAKAAKRKLRRMQDTKQSETKSRNEKTDVENK